MRFTERKEFTYDPAMFTRYDTTQALKFHCEAIRKHSPVPYPEFYEVDRQSFQMDELWHYSLAERTKFSRVFGMPVIVQVDRPDWRLTKVGIVPQQKLKIWADHTLLKEADYFPVRGDFVVYNGYRNLIVNVVIEPNSIWQQTNVWLGLLLETVIPAEGDARPNPTVAGVLPSEA